MTISFHFETGIKLKNRLLLKQFLKTINKEEGKSIGKVNFIFCSDDYLLKINREFLNHNFFTDIITFDYKDPKGLMSTGEIYISVDRIKENATKFSVEVEEELYRVIFHGILHLIGYADKTHTQKLKMRAKEDYYLGKYLYFVSRGT